MKKIKIGNIYITSWGIGFLYHGDSVEYIWPWKRIGKNWKFISWGFDNVFKSLKDIDDLWDQYFEDLQKD